MPPGKGFYGPKYRESGSKDKRLTPLYLLAAVPLLAVFALVGKCAMGGGGGAPEPASASPNLAQRRSRARPRSPRPDHGAPLPAPPLSALQGRAQASRTLSWKAARRGSAERRPGWCCLVGPRPDAVSEIRTRCPKSGRAVLASSGFRTRPAAWRAGSDESEHWHAACFAPPPDDARTARPAGQARPGAGP